MLRLLIPLVVVCFITSSTAMAHIAGFDTSTSDILPSGTARFGTMTRYAQSMNLFDIGLTGDLIVGPMFYAQFGLGGRTEFLLHWDGYRSLYNDTTYGDSADWGDPYFFTKVRVLQGGELPKLAFSIGAKEPATSDKTHVGTDETDILFKLHVTKEFGDYAFHSNWGVGIFGDRDGIASQTDAFLYSLLLEHKWSESVEIGVEFSGQCCSNKYDLERQVIHLGLGLSLTPVWRIQMVTGLGLIPQSERWSILFGLEYEAVQLYRN